MLLSAAMAFYAVATHMLPQTALHLASLLSEGDSLATDGSSGFFHFCYWSLFLLLIAVSIYVAVFDLRFIRAQYAIEAREVFRRTLGEESVRESLQKDGNGKHS